MDLYVDFNINNPIYWNSFKPSIKKAYYERVEKFFLDERTTYKHHNLTQVFDKIINDSKVLLSKDCIFCLYGLVDYLKKQKLRIDHIKSCIPHSFDNILISSFVVKVALFDIEEAIKLKNIQISQNGFLPDFAPDMYKIIWDSIKIMDTFDITSSDEDTYKELRAKYESRCKYNRIDTRSDKQKHKDAIDGFFDDFSGCIFIIIFFLICMLIGVITSK